MATYSWPQGRVWPAAMTLRQFHNQRTNTSSLNGESQTISVPGARWGWALDWAPQPERERAAIEAILTRLSGQEHRILMWDFKRPRPAGTINLAGVTASAAAQFATSITLNGCGANATMLAGDWFSIAGQLLRAVVDATANGSGVMTVEFRHQLRAAVAGGAAVTLSRPTALYALASSSLDLPRQPGRIEPPMSAELVERFT